MKSASRIENFERRDCMKAIFKNKLLILLIVFFMLFISSIEFVNSQISNKKNNNISNFKDLDMVKDNILVKFENKGLNLTLPIYVENNRYYFPVSEIVKNLKGKVQIENNIINLQLQNSNVKIDCNNNKFIINKKKHNLKKKIIVKGNIIYASMFDFTNFFDLKTYWNVKNKSINFYGNRDKVYSIKEQQGNKASLIRLEDITAGGIYSSSESLEKLRIVANYLYGQNIPFHVAWIPRYIKPSENIDNDISQNYSMYNAEFIFTLDYFTDKGGIIGLHGYTHQYGNTESVDGLEFHTGKKDNIPDGEEYAKERVDKAIDAAKKLDIQCDFFEVPHYGILKKQLGVLEEKFKYIYEPYSEDAGITEFKSIIKTNRNGRTTLYIPTPLNYVDGKVDCNNMLKRIENIDKKLLGSFFYHPYIEFEDIKINRGEDGYPYYSYSEQSVLHKIITKFRNQKYKFYKISDFK